MHNAREAMLVISDTVNRSFLLHFTVRYQSYSHRRPFPFSTNYRNVLETFGHRVMRLCRRHFIKLGLISNILTEWC